MAGEKYRNADEALRAALSLPDAGGLALTLPPALLARDRRLEDVTFLARGGMGAVYRAFDLSLEREVAIKLVRPGRLSGELAERLRREAQVLTALRHPYIVELLRVEEHEGQLLLVMEYVPGTPLRRFARAQAELAPIVHVMLAAAEALCAVHASGLVHRDFKPENVLVRGDGSPCLLDFGLVRALEKGAGLHTFTKPGDVLGTAGYMAPEQARGERGDAASDQYAWAVTTWEACTGRHPHATQPGRDLRTPQRTLPAGLRAVLLTAMADEPAERFSALSEALHAARTALSLPAPAPL